MYKHLKLYLNDVDVTDSVIVRQGDLKIRQKYRDYKATIGVLLDINGEVKVKTGQEIFLKYTNQADETRTLFGGYIVSIDRGELSQDGHMELFLDCDGFYPSLPGRRTINDILDAELDPPYGVTDPGWEYYAGYLAGSYVEKYLFEDGVTIGNLERGRLLAETELETFVTMSIKEIWDALAEPSGDTWWIDNDKKFYFGSILVFDTYDSAADTISLNNDKYIIRGSREDMTGFINKVFIEGSEDWDEDIPEAYQDINGRIFYVLENTDSINYFKALNGNSGVFGTVIRDDKITNLATAQYRAEKLLSRYPDVPKVLMVDTFEDKFKPGDKIKVDLDLYDINDELFTIHEITVEMISGKKPIFKMELSNVPELGGTENLYHFFDQLNQKVSLMPSKPLQPIEFNPGGDGEIEETPLMESLVTWFDPEKEGAIQVINGLTTIFDTNGQLIATSYDSYWPSNPTDHVYEESIDYKKTIRLEIGYSLHMGSYTWRVGRLIPPEPIPIGTAFIVSYNRAIGTGNKGFPLGRPFVGGYNTMLANYYEPTELNPLRFPDNYQLPYELYVNGDKVDITTQPKIGDQFVLTTVVLSRGYQPLKMTNIGQNTSSKSSTPGANSGGYEGNIGEFIVFNRRLQSNEIEAVNNYLMNKYNIQTGLE